MMKMHPEMEGAINKYVEHYNKTISMKITLFIRMVLK